MNRSIYALAACCLFVCSSVSAQNKSLDHLLTNETVFVWNWSGNQTTSDAYQQTASYQAFHESGLVPAFARLGDSIPWTQLVAAYGDEFPISWMQLKNAWSHVRNHGAAVGIGIRGDDAENARPYGLLVIPEAGPFAPAVENFYQQLERFEESGGGSVPQIDFPGMNPPAIQFPFGASWQPLSSPAPSATYSAPSVSPFQSNDSLPGRATPASDSAGSPYYESASSDDNETPARVNTEAFVQMSSPATPTYVNESELPPQPSLASTGEIPRVVAAAEPVEPLSAPRPKPEHAPAESWKIEKSTIGEREIYRLSGVVDPDVPDLQFAWWEEDDDLVFYYGMSPVADYLEGLQDEDNRLVKSELWNSAFDPTIVESEAGDLAETSRVWLNIERIAQLYADMPIAGFEPAMTVRKLIEPTGLLGLRAIGFRSGYRRQNLVSITRTVTEPPRTGLLSLLDESTFTLDDLPPLPANVSAFTARAIDFGKTYREVQNLAEQYVTLGGDEGELYWRMIKQQTAATDGFDIEKDLLAHLGHVAVTYDDSQQEVFGWGTSAVAIAVTDPDALLEGINRWRDSANENVQSDIRILRRERRGYTIFAVTGRKSFLSPSFAVSGNWLVIGWQPQTVEAFQLRTAGKLPVWLPEELAEENRSLIAQRFQQLQYSDPRSTVRTLVSLAPWALEGIRWYAGLAAEAGIEWNPGVSSLDVPPAELIVAPLYPNLTVTRFFDDVIHTERWASSNVDQSTWWLAGAYCGLALLAD